MAGPAAAGDLAGAVTQASSLSARRDTGVPPVPPAADPRQSAHADPPTRHLPTGGDACVTPRPTTHFALATNADDADIRRLLRNNAMPGAVSLTFEREPDYFRGAAIAGAHDQTIVAFRNGRLVCMGRCAWRDCWVDGVPRRVGYLGELRLDAAARGRFGILRDGYRFFHALQRDRPAELYFTAIAAGNEHARRLLERGARGLPAYYFLAELETLLVAVPRRPRATSLRIDTATPERLPDVLRLLNESARRHELATVWTADTLRSLALDGLPLNRFLIALDSGEIVACGALWDQRAFRQTVIRGYSRALTAARPLVNFAGRFLRAPRLPRVGSVLDHAFLSPLAFASGAEALLPDFIEAFLPLAEQAGAEFLTIALPPMDSQLPALRRRFSTRTWRSRLYRVDWPGEAPFGFGKRAAPFLPDVALL